MNPILKVDSFLLIGLVLLLICVIAMYVVYWNRNRQLHLWKNTLQLDKHGSVFESIFNDVNGFKLSQTAKLNCDAIDYVYGEIEFLPFSALLSLAHPNSDTVFYDLGSGIGKAVIGCAMVFPVKHAFGIEIFPLLHQASCDQLSKLIAFDTYKHLGNTVKFFQGDILSYDFSDATMVFINASTFVGSTWISLMNRIENTAAIQTVITTSKPLNSPCFTQELSTSVEMSWGVVQAYIHHRV